MEIGLIGMPLSGKTTFFSLMTNIGLSGDQPGKAPASTGIARVPDKRIDFLSGIYKPKKTTYATIEVTDIKGFASGAADSGGASANPFLDSVRVADALVHVVRAFRNENIFHVEGNINPMKDIETINTELIIADLSVVENRINRIETSAKAKKNMQSELETLKKCRDILEDGRMIPGGEFSDEEIQLLKPFGFLTARPQVLLVNVDEEQYRSFAYMQKDQVLDYAKRKNIPVLEICAGTELEINRLNDEDKVMFMEDLGIEEPGTARLASIMYNRLGLISFLTVGEDEVRAWPVKQGITARAAGGKIHSDIEKGFIRAEVVSFDDFKESGSMQKAREKGLVRLEGKEYIIQDGDIVNFRFNV